MSEATKDDVAQPVPQDDAKQQPSGTPADDGDAKAGASARSASSGSRKRWLAIAAGAFVLIGAGYARYWALFLRYSQSTDDAYVSGRSRAPS